MQKTPEMGPEIGQAAVLLTATEVGLGSLVHGLHFPLGGHFLSLNQSFLLSRGTLQGRGLLTRTYGFTVSNVAALLKTLSPAGKKLTPMVAISAQGLLFSVGTLIFGNNVAGAAFGSALSSVWAFAQPLLVYYILFGQSFFDALKFYLSRFSDLVHVDSGALLLFLSGLVFLKLLLAVAAVGLAYGLPENRVSRYLASVGRFNEKVKTAPAAGAKGVLREVFSPVFWLWLSMTVLYFVFSEKDTGQIIWKSLRPVALMLIFYFVARRTPWSDTIEFFERRGFHDFARHFRSAAQAMRLL